MGEARDRGWFANAVVLQRGRWEDIVEVWMFAFAVEKRGDRGIGRAMAP